MDFDLAFQNWKISNILFQQSWWDLMQTRLKIEDRIFKLSVFNLEMLLLFWNENISYSNWKSILNQKSLVMTTKMSPIIQNFKTLSKEQLQRAHGLNLDAGKGIKTESYRINSSPIQDT